MALFKDLTKESESVLLDGNEFINCEFQGCNLVYRGGELPRLQQCRFARCAWHLEEGAQRTIQFLRSIYHSGPGGRELVEETLRHVRTR
jgi:hypothetical protein